MKRVGEKQYGDYEKNNCVLKELFLLEFGNDVIVVNELEPKTEN
jgi:hypothetical protein